MFEITLNGKTLYHPNSLDCMVTRAIIYEELNDSGYMDVVIPHINPMYNEIAERRGKIIVYKDNVERWYGEVRDISVDFSKNKALYVVGEAAYLNDTVQPLKQYTSLTKFQLLEQFLNIHNSMVEEDKKFYPGVVAHNANVVREVVTDWEYTLDAIRNHLCDDEEYFRIRHINGVRYVDIMPLEIYGKRSTQPIMFGDNLLDYAEESSGENIATVCIPLGQTVEDENAVENYENYLTCENAPGQDGKNYVYLPGAVNRLGWIMKVVHFDVLDTPEALVTAGMNYLQSAQYAKLTLSLTAVDMSILQNSIDNIELGDYVRAICEPFGMDTWFPVRERETDLINIANNKIIVGAEGVKSITQQQTERIDNIEKAMPSRESVINAALRVASALINANGEEGNVSVRLDKNGNPYEIVVMNADSLKQSTRAWRWNLSGFGHGSKEAGADEFTWEANVALTMDGEVVAEKGSIAGFTIYTQQVLDGLIANYLQQETERGRVRWAFYPESGNSAFSLVQYLKDGTTKSTSMSPGELSSENIYGKNLYANNVNVMDYIGNVDAARVNSANSLSSAINSLNDRCNSLYSYIQSVHNLVNTYHPPKQ